jgi:hypothetical protein
MVIIDEVHPAHVVIARVRVDGVCSVPKKSGTSIFLLFSSALIYVFLRRHPQIVKMGAGVLAVNGAAAAQETVHRKYVTRTLWAYIYCGLLRRTLIRESPLRPSSGFKIPGSRPSKCRFRPICLTCNPTTNRCRSAISALRWWSAVKASCKDRVALRLVSLPYTVRPRTREAY